MDRRMAWAFHQKRTVSDRGFILTSFGRALVVFADWADRACFISVPGFSRHVITRRPVNPSDTMLLPIRIKPGLYGPVLKRSWVF